ncbi:5955_t:CDS:1 [Acaulospora colombiana]|uniref:5955_t:CDS:1 n=1 Tax=Acaulospora colombiana TaxID=27376 RepID=A0ACA9KWD5_9GLOM|nr:5955_t:CDS:1 [Acaulospora colombiana]
MSHSISSASRTHPYNKKTSLPVIKSNPESQLILNEANLSHFTTLDSGDFPKPHMILPKNPTITTEMLDDIINSKISNEKRVIYESKLFLPLHNLIFFSHSPKRTSDFPCYQNSFVIFRKDFQAKLSVNRRNRFGSFLKDDPLDTAKSEKRIWKDMSSEDKHMYDQLLLCNNTLHDILWSNYRYWKSRNERCEYEYAKNGSIKICSPTFFMPVSRNQKVNNPSLHFMISDQALTPRSHYMTLDPPVASNHSLSSYDKSIKDSIDKNMTLP